MITKSKITQFSKNQKDQITLKNANIFQDSWLSNICLFTPNSNIKKNCMGRETGKIRSCFYQFSTFKTYLGWKLITDILRIETDVPRETKKNHLFDIHDITKNSVRLKTSCKWVQFLTEQNLEQKIPNSKKS